MKQIRIRAGDSHTLVLVRSGCARGAVVALTHGTFSGTASCDRLGEYLAAQGFSTWLFDWRGHGRNPDCHAGHDLETVAMHDIGSAIEAIRSEERGRPLTLMGHSGGHCGCHLGCAQPRPGP
jgi:oxygen-independent coproporphyrinogen-3 oxidase